MKLLTRWNDPDHRRRKLFNGIFRDILEQNWDSNSYYLLAGSNSIT